MPDINTVVVTPQVSTVAVNSSVPGSYDSVARLGLDWLSVTDPIYGAVGDGTTNDTAAIQAALDDATSGAVVFFPPRTYLTDAVTLTGASDVTLLGEGATLKARTAGTGVRVLTLATCVRTAVVGLAIDGASKARCGVRISKVSEDITLERVSVRDITQYTGETDHANAIEVKPDGAATAPSGVLILDCVVDGVSAPVTDVARAIYLGDSGGPGGVVPRNVQIRGGLLRDISGANGDAIQFADTNAGTAVSDSIVDGVTFRECSKRALKVDAQRVTVVNCDIRNDVASFISAPISLYASHQVCTGNRIYGPRSLHGIEIGAALDLEDVVCLANTIELDSGTTVVNHDGIAVMKTLVGFNISGNVITKCRSGISFTANTGSPTTGVVSGNILKDFTANAGIRSDTTSPLLTTGVVFANNVFDTATGGVGILLKDGSLNLAVGNVAKSLGGSQVLVFGMTTDAVCLRWNNVGGTAHLRNNTFTALAQFTQPITVARVVGGGTAHVAGDYVASANWGTSPTITPLARDTGGRVSVLAQATTGANPTLVLTFKDGTWTTIPAISYGRGDTNATAGRWSLSSVTATTATWTFVGTPTAGETYVLDFTVTGK